MLLSFSIIIVPRINSKLNDKTTSNDNTDLKKYVGRSAQKDIFTVFEGKEDEIYAPNLDEIQGVSADKDMIFKKHLVELPLVAQDYYYGKFINASSAVNEINTVPILHPGDRINLIGQNYLTLSKNRGYVYPGQGFLYASGVCWSTSSVGTLMDEVNHAFIEKYSIPLFTFHYGDRTPHPAIYSTYQDSNFGRGYTIVKVPSGYSTDYSFEVNSAVSKIKGLENLKIKIVMFAREDCEKAFAGQSIGAYLQTNIDF
jgi:hypothetical protein